jgi:hypothetical protein
LECPDLYVPHDRVLLFERFTLIWQQLGRNVVHSPSGRDQCKQLAQQYLPPVDTVARTQKALPCNSNATPCNPTQCVDTHTSLMLPATPSAVKVMP